VEELPSESVLQPIKSASLIAKRQERDAMQRKNEVSKPNQRSLVQMNHQQQKKQQQRPKVPSS